jgi:hypothetical protein
VSRERRKGKEREKDLGVEKKIGYNVKLNLENMYGKMQCCGAASFLCGSGFGSG